MPFGSKAYGGWYKFIKGVGFQAEIPALSFPGSLFLDKLLPLFGPQFTYLRQGKWHDLINKLVAFVQGLNEMLCVQYFAQVLDHSDNAVHSGRSTGGYWEPH